MYTTIILLFILTFQQKHDVIWSKEIVLFYAFLWPFKHTAFAYIHLSVGVSNGSYKKVKGDEGLYISRGLSL